MIHRGQVVEDVEASWEPVIPRNIYEDVVALLSHPERRTAPGQKPQHLLSSVIYCGVCGGVMRSSTGNGETVYKCASKLNAQALGERHSSIAARLVDPLVRDAVVAAFLLGPASVLPDEDTPDLGPLDAELAKVRRDRARYLQLVEDEAVDIGDVSGKLHELKSREVELKARKEEAIRVSGQRSMLPNLRADLWIGNRPAQPREFQKARAALGERFDGLDLAKKRELVRTLLDVKVFPGRRLERVAIRHKVVLGLNEDADVALDVNSTDAA